MLYVNPIANLDSVTYGQLVDADTFFIVIDRESRRIVYDTFDVHVPGMVFHDTIRTTHTIYVKPSRRIGVFSVAGDKKVSFSQGNLQYIQNQDFWKFADQQYEYIGKNNVKDGQLANKIDLFGWSADNKTAPFGVRTSTDAADYAGEFVDWGSNVINGDAPDTWRTLSKEEWEYLINKRDNASDLYGVAQVVGENGLILLPDNWVAPDGIIFKAGLQSKYSVCQSFTLEQWEKMEDAGAVFLPASGYRIGVFVSRIDSAGNYWSSTRRNSSYAEYLAFGDKSNKFRLYVDAINKTYRGRSVRLVHDTIVPEYVDLGLSVKWATFNIGAISPEDYGDYFAWGEVKPKNNYSISTYKWSEGTKTSFTKYVTNSHYGIVDDNGTLDPEDDVATIYWKDNWRMPTDAEWAELRTNCTWTNISVSGVEGYKVTSKIEGYTDKSIFLPAAGYRSSKSIAEKGKSGRYLSSSLYMGDPLYSRRLHFSSTSRSNGRHSRWLGYSVRPVYGAPTLLVPEVTTSAATQISSYSALVGGRVIRDGSACVTEYGIVYSLSENPTIEDNKLVSNEGMGLYYITLNELEDNSTYYVRAYAINASGVGYGEQISFTTGCYNYEDTTGIIDGHAYVDLGLSVMWATCNVGAISPTEYGDYYSWGENNTKSEYSRETYRWYNSEDSVLTKYCLHSKYGIVDNLITLEPSDDAAFQWGGDWRMPTEAEWAELRENCTWYWTCINGINGYKVVAQNGNSIFLPAAGYQLNDAAIQIDSYGYYWSNELNRYFSEYAQIISFDNTNISNYYEGRFCGLSVRPVLVYEEDKIPDPCMEVKVNDTLAINMMCVKGGKFVMGDDSNAGTSPAHEVTLSDYYIGQVEVSQALWKAVMGTNPSKFSGNNLPVECVSWEDCQLFVQKLSEMTGLRFRLPTEAEWEYAARGGVKSRGYTYSGSNDIDSVAWYGDNADNKTHSIAGKKPNELGIYDMTGNVWEWCQDWHEPYTAEAQVNPQGADEGEERVLRGGANDSKGSACFVSCRVGRLSNHVSHFAGLRLVLEISSKK